MNDRGAEVKRVIYKTPWYLTEYVYECVRCGTEFIRHQHGPHISPYCGTCKKEIDYHNNLMKQRAREKAATNELIELIKMSVCQSIDTYKEK